ncbi:CDP-glycerol glycerophosphotransferase family protein [Methanobacterium alcaliphilum]|uniref:CDP-glycerol glycerophosphotransferase family protein n=1 Tax=Methanobacterium alcaliphilum TaxID=392018 RepID=UPI00200A0296|nr:CDP-glycerol glycerophosphotransferase family protein [Methanobacterium alcaliphilum]MCK9152260.1 CDP-glycerol glycerophosphotransferase family protein [Methanobacterium alcaliphilum]
MDKAKLFKGIAYSLMALFFYISYLFPVNSKKILLIMTHDDSDEGNIGSVHDYFKKRDPDLIFKKITRDDYNFKINKNIIRNLLIMFIYLPYQISTSHIIFMDNVFLPFSSIKPKKNTQLIQLWHGTGSIKKFGVDSEEGWIRDRAMAVCKNTTHFIVGSNWMKNIYKTAFKAEDEKIFNIGCPRTDLFFNEDSIKSKSLEFFKEYPELKNKKIILYAPTFRDGEDVEIRLELDKMISKLKDVYVLGLRLHPHIAGDANIEEMFSKEHYSDKIYDFSHYPKLSTLMVSSNILITDYSSIIYEYALLQKPMIFYSYDLETFEKKDRGFYGDYKTSVPGPIAYKTDEIIDMINKGSYGYDLSEFLSIYLENCDGRSRERLYGLLF